MWIDRENIIVYRAGVKDEKTNKVAFFDMDGTLIKTKSGRKFPRDKNDWCRLNDSVVNKLIELIQENYKIAIITNQNGIQRGSTKKEDIMYKIDQIRTTVDQKNHDNSFYACISVCKDSWRKPKPAFFESFEDYFPLLNKSECFFVGDAAGRNGDFSASDRDFARNSGIKFYTPEEYFV